MARRFPWQKPQQPKGVTQPPVLQSPMPQQMPGQGTSEQPQEESTAEGGGEQAGQPQGPSKQPESKKEGGGDKEGGGKTPSGTGGQKPGGGSDIDKARHLASGSAEDKKEAVKQEILDKALMAAGPYGRAAAYILKAVPYIKKYWWIPVFLIVGIVFFMAVLSSCSFLEREAGGSTEKESVKFLDTKIAVVASRALASQERLTDFTNDVWTRQNEVITAMRNLLNKENEQIRGTSQKAKLISLLDQYMQKLRELKQYVDQIQSEQLNIKPEESLTEKEFTKRNELQNKIDAKYKELEALMTSLEKEFNNCDALAGQNPNSLGFYHLADSGSYQKFISSTYNDDKEPFYLEAMPYCATIYIANQFQSKTGQKLWVGEASLASGGMISGFEDSAHLDGRTVIYSGPGIARNSQEIFGVAYNSELAKWFAQKLYEAGVGVVYFNDSQLNKQVTTNLLGDKVPLATPSSGVDDHWSVSFNFPDI